MSLQILISTMHQKDYSLLEKMNICSDAVVINQCNENSEVKIKIKGYSILWINSKERGLSKSRNLAIKYATSDICLLADDDEIFIEEGIKSIESIFKNYPKASIIRFQIKGIEEEYKTYPLNSKKLNYFTAMKISSVEIAFRRKNILESNVVFDELVGSGAEFICGEENVFINECLSKGLRVYYYPKVIANLHLGESTWFSGYNYEYFRGQGGSFMAMSPKYGRLLILQFAVRHWHIYSEIKFLEALLIMFNAAKEYRIKKNKLKELDEGKKNETI